MHHTCQLVIICYMKKSGVASEKECVLKFQNYTQNNFKPLNWMSGWVRVLIWIFFVCLKKDLYSFWGGSLLFLVCVPLWFQALVSSQFHFLFVQKGKVQSHSGSWGKSLLNTNPQVSVLSWPWESSSKLFYCKHHMCVLLDQVRRGQSSPEAWTADLDCFSAA